MDVQCLSACRCSADAFAAVEEKSVLDCNSEFYGGWLQAQEFAKVMEPLFKQVAKCLNSFHFQVRHKKSPLQVTGCVPCMLFSVC